MGIVIEIIFLIVIVLIILLNIIILKISKKLKSVSNETELSGFEIAKIISNKYSRTEPYIIKKSGKNLDYYDKDRNVIKLTKEVFDGTDMYASLIAFNVTMDNSTGSYKFNAFITLVSYIVIILGAFLNNGSIIHLGLIIFVFGVILELLIINKFKYADNELDEYLKNEDIIKPYEENKSNIKILKLVNIANLPYRFITFFR